MRLEYAYEGFWLAKRRNYSEHTIADHELTFRRLRQFVGDKEIDDIISADLNHFLDHLANKLNLSPKTIMNHWIALSSFWTWASGDLKYCSSSPVPRLPAPSFARAQGIRCQQFLDLIEQHPGFSFVRDLGHHAYPELPQAGGLAPQHDAPAVDRPGRRESEWKCVK